MNFSIPQITVLMPAYNAGKYIGDAITSVLEQTFTDFELLIINDGSTDDTVDVVRSFDDPRIVVIYQDNKGIAGALNNGLKYARAPYIARFDADDICYPERLQLQYDFMIANPEYSVIGSAADYIDMEGHFLFTHKPPAFDNNEIQQLKYSVCPFIHSCVFYKKDMVISKGGYNEHAYTFEDHFLWVNILKDQKACNLAQPLIKVRLNPESITIDEKWRPRKFRDIKYATLKSRVISKREGSLLAEIGEKQYSAKIKHGSYYAICGKKLLINNFQPQKARVHVARAISISPLRLDNYLLYIVSYLPERVINWLHKLVSGGAAI
ncbi:glycosyltransferase family 2 protein [Mucilaginibacter ginsenosidivorax]|uniref:Glycosyltransferase family 2 protein n=1 Tax=Mucilaginibacter ginsenosidivorax TaxID=862126 RepID=A0A5B8W8G5_9SPHI|nr:glycosyltransferase family 2 protein [Mucilaginibacter ginsenosidivorax]QEC80063.1 glycosyltransferase family 2 protein [Mucilaginibacter ginsenosidivorax]